MNERVGLRDWIGVLGALLGAFMAVLDIQITNASLKDITGALGATLDEGSWISTSYLTTEIVIIPLSGWIVSVLGIRRYLLATASVFLVFSALCGCAWNLASMVTFRALQGLSGGALIPLAFQIIMMKLPPSKRPTGFALFSITATFAPSIGPTVGGWLTENYGWPLIFFINIVPGAALLASSWLTLERAPVRVERLRTGDWCGIATMALGLSALTVFLEEGERRDWFGSPLLTRMAAIAVVMLGAFVVIELWLARAPLLDLRLFKERNFTLGSVINVCFGLGMYASGYVLPLYLAQVQRYNALQIGRTVMWSGVPQLALIPLIPKLMRFVDGRVLIAMGLMVFAASAFANSHLDADVAYDQLRFSQTLRAIGQPLIMVPLSSLAMTGIPPRSVGSASGLFNMVRNLGGSIGLALTSGLLTQREHLHSSRLGEAVSAFNPLTRERLAMLASGFVQQGFDPATAQAMALRALDVSVRKQAFLLAYADCFFLIGATLLSAVVAVLLARRSSAQATAGDSH